MKLQQDPVRRFSHVSPIYNWIYPIAGSRRPGLYSENIASLLTTSLRHTMRSRGLYVHIPFCETICTFCPLVKSPLEEQGVLDAYVRALLAEIALKAQDPDLTRLPIRTMFFGGGTPSLLRVEDIRQIGRALHDAFDLGCVEEFSVEMEVKSVCAEKLAAFREIGVTHARFGVQTFAARHRQAFNLTATIAQIKQAAALLLTYFPYVSCDMLYGLNGQTAEEFLEDIERVVGLGLNNIDFYPLNVFVTQKKLHRNYQALGLSTISGLTKIYMTRVLREIMHSNGYLPHNGHGYVKASPDEIARDPIVTRSYAFKYHQHVYGTDDDEFIGIGNSAQSYIAGRTITNVVSRARYINALIEEGVCPLTITDHENHVNASKAIAITLPYLGYVARARIRWDDLPEGAARRLEELAVHGLIEMADDEIRLTREGWFWYVNLMYYLAPREEQAALGAIMLRGEAGGRLRPGEMGTLTATG